MTGAVEKIDKSTHFWHWHAWFIMHNLKEGILDTGDTPRWTKIWFLLTRGVYRHNHIRILLFITELYVRHYLLQSGHLCLPHLSCQLLLCFLCCWFHHPPLANTWNLASSMICLSLTFYLQLIAFFVFFCYFLLFLPCVSKCVCVHAHVHAKTSVVTCYLM